MILIPSSHPVRPLSPTLVCFVHQSYNSIKKEVIIADQQDKQSNGYLEVSTRLMRQTSIFIILFLCLKKRGVPKKNKKKRGGVLIVYSFLSEKQKEGVTGKTRIVRLRMTIEWHQWAREVEKERKTCVWSDAN